MRIDARNLLDRLGRNDFAYKEFEDRFTELELWPILEALLRDPRLQAIDEADRVDLAAAADEPELVKIEPAQTAPAAEPLTSMFSRYGAPAASSMPIERRDGEAQDVRAILRRLSDLGSRGEI